MDTTRRFEGYSKKDGYFLPVEITWKDSSMRINYIYENFNNIVEFTIIDANEILISSVNIKNLDVNFNNYELYRFTSMNKNGEEIISMRFLDFEFLGIGMDDKKTLEKLSRRISLSNKRQAYYDKVNTSIIASERKKIQKIEDEFNRINFSNYESIANNFLKILPDLLFLYLDNYREFEATLGKLDNYCIHFLDIELSEINNIVDKQKTQLIADIVQNFIRFSKMISIKFNVIEAHSFSISWKLLKTAAIDYFSLEWQLRYKHLFSDISDILCINEYIDRYCLCQDIVHKNTRVLHLFVYFLMSKNIISKDNFLVSASLITDKIIYKLEQIEQNAFEYKILHGNPLPKEKISFDDIDIMTGGEFEQFILELFIGLGYESEVTKHTGDQGIDVIVLKNGDKIGIQVKRYSGSVGNRAVQEAVAGKAFYSLDKVMVVTNNYFTSSAINLAIANNVILWDRNILKEKILNIW